MTTRAGAIWSACGRRGSRDQRSSREASRRTARGLLWTTLGAALASAEHLERTGAPGDEWKVSSGYDRRGLVSATTARIRLPELLFFGVFWWATPLIRMFKKKG